MKRCRNNIFKIFLESIGVKGGMIWLGNAPAGSEEVAAAPYPLSTIVGVSLPIRFTSYFFLSPDGSASLEAHLLVDLNAYFPIFHSRDGEETKFYLTDVRGGA